jgi:hypothetical protein
MDLHVVGEERCEGPGNGGQYRERARSVTSPVVEATVLLGGEALFIHGRRDPQ